MSEAVECSAVDLVAAFFTVTCFTAERLLLVFAVADLVGRGSSSILTKWVALPLPLAGAAAGAGDFFGGRKRLDGVAGV